MESIGMQTGHEGQEMFHSQGSTLTALSRALSRARMLLGGASESLRPAASWDPAQVDALRRRLTQPEPAPRAE